MTKFINIIEFYILKTNISNNKLIEDQNKIYQKIKKKLYNNFILKI